ncbi:ubiquinol-cytochrome-c reductase complex assembly factor 1-like [Ornithodoros turicata]|uniref:ubiquinol-cytochrome-c reductase complex assembly factor 1-like n=1 Tax=Ornithodoros turicata TaxID=34597 RepID=UPI00313903D1
MARATLLLRYAHYLRMPFGRLVEPCSRVFHTDVGHQHPIRSAHIIRDSRWGRLKAAFAWYSSEQYKMKRATVYIYESCVDGVDLGRFFKYLKIPDTFLSWFFITELHVWICLTRVMAEQDERKALYLRNEIITNMWSDTQQRIKKLARMPLEFQKEGMQDLSEHFQAAMTLYDEGLQGDDKALASALWRVLLACDGEDLASLETLIHYVRNHVHKFDKMSFEEFIAEGNITWTPLLDFVPRDMR